MTLFEKFINFLKNMFSFEEEENSEKNLLPETFEESYEEESKEDYRLNLAKRTILTRLYTIEQKITVFETEFPEKFQEFTQRINTLKEDYISSLENAGKELTFDIDPDNDGEKLGMIGLLDSEIDKFIETEVKFNIIYKSLQKSIVVLNDLYNASIVHFKPEDKAKVISQVECGVEKIKELTKQFKECFYITNNKQLRETMVNLISYADYLIFKIKLRNNSSVTPNELIKESIMMSNFDNFDYITTLRTFSQDEISDLGKLLPLLNNEEYRKVHDKKIKKLLRDLAFSTNPEEDQILDNGFWNNYFSFETSYIQFLKDEGVESSQAKVKLLERMNISISDNEVWVLPITTAYMTLTDLFVKTRDNRLLALNKMLRNLSNKITYKEIYYLITLFEVVDIVVENQNDLLRHIEKYIAKNPYNKSVINKRKEEVKRLSNKDFVYVFNFKNNESNVYEILQRLNFDFCVEDDKIYFNSFYFNGLENVMESLEINTQNIINGGNQHDEL